MMLGTNYPLQMVLQVNLQHHSLFFFTVPRQLLHKRLISCLDLMQCTSVNLKSPIFAETWSKSTIEPHFEIGACYALKR